MAQRPCPHCGETIQNAATICRFCNREVPKIDDHVAAKTKLRESLAGIVLCGIIGFGVYAWESNRQPSDGTTKDDTAAPPALRSDDDTGDAEQVISETIATPSTARYLSANVIAKEGVWRMVHVVVDAQNNFGAMLRKSLCVTYFRDGGKIRWGTNFGVQECSREPTADEIQLLKGLNDWAKTNRAPSAQ